MLEARREQRCPEAVFPLAMSYVDRYPGSVPTRRAPLQLVGAVCLLLASKLPAPQPLTVERLCLYAASSFTAGHIRDWEVLVLGKLQWDMMWVAPCEFVDPILQLLPLPQPERLPVVKKQARMLAVLCVIECPSDAHQPAVIAATSIAAAARRLSPPSSDPPTGEELLSRLASLVRADPDCLKVCLERMAAAVAETLHRLSSPQQDPDA